VRKSARTHPVTVPPPANLKGVSLQRLGIEPGASGKLPDFNRQHLVTDGFTHLKRVAAVGWLIRYAGLFRRFPGRFDLAHNPRRHFSQIPRTSADMFDDLWIQLPFKEWKYHMPHLVTEDCNIAVGRILTPGYSSRLQECAQLAAAQIEQRTDEHYVADNADRFESGKAIRSRCSLQPHEKRLCDIVHVVAGCNAVQPQTLHRLREERQSFAPCRHLDGFALLPHDLDPRRMERQPEASGKTAHEFGVIRRIPADPMIKMKNNRVETVFLAQFRHQDEKSDGIRAPRHGKPDFMDCAVRRFNPCFRGRDGTQGCPSPP